MCSEATEETLVQCAAGGQAVGASFGVGEVIGERERNTSMQNLNGPSGTDFTLPAKQGENSPKWNFAL